MKLEGRHLRGIYFRGESLRERGAFSGAESLVPLEEGGLLEEPRYVHSFPFISYYSLLFLNIMLFGVDNEGH